MTEKIRVFKEEINSIPVPTDKLDEIILNTFQTVKSKKKKSIQTKVLWSIGSVAVFCVLIVSSTYVSPVMASVVFKIPIIGPVFINSENLGLKQVSEQGLTDLIAETKSVDGTSVTVEEVFYDETRLTIGFSLKSDTSIEEGYLSSGPDFTIDGKSISSGGSYGETKISSTHLTGILDVESLSELPSSFTLGLTFKGEDGKAWDFAIPVSKKSSFEQVVINHSQEVEEIKLNVPSLKVSPRGLELTFSAESIKTDYFSLGKIDFKVMDSKGNELTSHSGVSKREFINNIDYYTGTVLVDPIQTSSEVLTITPYLKFSSEITSAEIDHEGNEVIKEIKPFDGEDIIFESFIVKLPGN